MKRPLLNIISVIIIISFSVCITSCSELGKMGTAKNNNSTISRTNGTSIQNSSPDSSAIMPTQLSSITSGDNIDTIDYNQFIKKVWVVENSINNYKDYYPSFRISKIANGEILGELSLIDLSLPNPEYNSPSDICYRGDFTGTINKNIAECQFRFKTGDTGNIKLIFESNKEIKATFEYKNRSQDITDEVQNLRNNSINLHLDGTYQFKPYNLNSFNRFIPCKDQSFIVDLNSWGKIRFVSGKYDSGKHILTVRFLTNNDGDILYDFGSPFPYDSDIKAISFQNVNKDGFKDIIIIAECGGPRAYIYFQKPDGSFSDDDELEQEINNSGNNKDIKTVMDYLSKKF